LGNEAYKGFNKFPFDEDLDKVNVLLRVLSEFRGEVHDELKGVVYIVVF